MNSISSLCLYKNLLLYASYTCGEVFTKGFLVACANEANVCVLQRNIFVAEVFFCKLEHTCFEVTDVLVFLEILYHLPYEGAFVLRVVINSYRCHMPGHLFSGGSELAWNPPPNKYPKQTGSCRRNRFSCSCTKS